MQSRLDSAEHNYVSWQLTVALRFTGWSCSIDTVHSKYCNTELHTSRKCHCSVGVTSGDVVCSVNVSKL